MNRLGTGRYEPSRTLRRLKGDVFKVACLLATLTGLVFLGLLLVSILVATLRHSPDESIVESLRGLPAFLMRLVRRFSSSEADRAGFKAGLAGSLWLLGLVALMAIPTGVGTALYLEEYARPGRFKSIVQTNIANLAGVPSVVYGLLGLALFNRAFGYRSFALGPSLLTGALTLSLLVLPTVVIATREALRTVPDTLRQAALALGATKWQVVRDHVLPSALPGILTGTILALSRAVGETAPLLLVGAAGAIRSIPRGPGDRYTALPVEIYNYAQEPAVAFQSVAAGGILILLVLLLTMNAAAIVIRNRSARLPRA
jgi:phosphate transport system permease protein